MNFRRLQTRQIKRMSAAGRSLSPRVGQMNAKQVDHLRIVQTAGNDLEHRRFSEQRARIAASLGDWERRIVGWAKARNAAPILKGSRWARFTLPTLLEFASAT